MLILWFGVQLDSIYCIIVVWLISSLNRNYVESYKCVTFEINRRWVIVTIPDISNWRIAVYQTLRAHCT